MEITTGAQVAHLQAALNGRYTIERELGRGGMACVYLARDQRLDRDVAIKVLRPDLVAGQGVARFLREIRIESSLQHPHIVALLDSGAIETDSTGARLPTPLPYYVMPYIVGETLRDVLQRERQLPLEDSLRIVRDVGNALTYAHGQGVVHRDVKPANILLSGHPLRDRAATDGWHAWVADFGIARAITVVAADRLTETGLAVGTPDYMSPEQASGDSVVDGRSDVYALACVLYEMLTGEPPFSGRTAQAILARHRADPPPSARVLRPGVPEHIDVALHRALAKVAADRFRSVDDFLQALETPAAMPSAAHARATHTRIVPLVVAALLVLAALIGYAVKQRFVPLDSSKVVVFPLEEHPVPASDVGNGEAVATYLGYALEGTAPLRWLDGRDFLGAGRRARAESLGADEAGAVARRARARYFLDGAIVRGGDSVTVVLRLFDAAGDSLVRRAGATEGVASASLPQLGLRAMSELLPALLAPGRRVDLRAFSERNPSAITAFLKGEREYRELRFGRALNEYRTAIEADSGFALAALKGALAAGWLERSAEAQDLLALALQQRGQLSRKYRLFADGLSSYWSGAADSAALRFRQAAAVDPEWTEAWMSLGEVYYHLLPQSYPLDSFAEAAFVQAHRLEPDFTPALYHLVTAALRRDQPIAARAYFDTLRAVGADSTLQLPLTLMFECLDHGPEHIPWAESVSRDPAMVLEAAQPLITTPAQRACAKAAYLAVLQAPAIESRWGALLGLQGLLVAEGRYDELARLFVSSHAADLPGQSLYLLDAVADSALDNAAARVAARQTGSYAAMGGPNLWLLGEWEARRGNAEVVEQISRVLDSLSRTGTRRDTVLSQIMLAQGARASGDTSLAISRLSALTPTAPRAQLFWQPWEAMAAERMTLAQLMFGRRRFAAVDSLTAGLDNHRSVAFLPYLPAALRLRIRAAEALGNRSLAALLRQRLAELRSDSAASP